MKKSSLWRRWNVSLGLGGGYIVAFLLMTRAVGPPMAWGLGAGGAIAALIAVGRRNGYFANRWDLGFHSVAALDVVLEGALAPAPNSLGFFICFLAFAAIIGGYRQWALSAAAPPPQDAPGQE